MKASHNCYPFVMATLDRIRVEWSGGPGGNGVSTFYADPSATSALADIRALFLVIMPEVSDDITVAFPNSGDQIDSITGGLVGGWTRASAASIAGGAASSWVAGVGYRLVWETGVIFRGRRTRGSTFITGLGIAAFQNDGTIATTYRSNVLTAAQTLAATGALRIWSRPNGVNSGVATVNGATFPDRVSWLRTRRT